MEYYIFLFYILFGTLPCFAWLLYYLKKDLHPEPKRMIFKVFLLGAAVTVPTLVIQLGLLSQISNHFFELHPTLTALVTWFLIIGLTEEFLKYVVVKLSILKSYVVDEPLDIMLYMVVSSLGFAAVENTLYLLSMSRLAENVVPAVIIVNAWRFIGAIFLHTLCAALIGYFVALSSLKNKKGVLLTVAGIGLATFFHGLYDFALIRFSYPFNAIVPVLIIIVLAGFMMYDFDGIKKVKSICKIN